jgi:hypothetical protein
LRIGDCGLAALAEDSYNPRFQTSANLKALEILDCGFGGLGRRLL